MRKSGGKSFGYFQEKEKTPYGFAGLGNLRRISNAFNKYKKGNDPIKKRRNNNKNKTEA